MKMIPLPDILDFLSYTDLRAARNWCRKNNVLVLKQGKNEFVFEIEFKEKFERPFINKLKKEFGDEWEQVYRLYADGNIPALFTLQQIPTVKRGSYNSINKKKSEFLIMLEEHERTKAA